MRTRQATVDGVPLQWQEAGTSSSAPPVVLIHGIPTGPHLWREVMLHLPDRTQVINFEMVGYADSIPAGRDHDLGVAAQARHLHGLLDHLGIDRAVLVGHDLGGGVAQIAAVQQPERCAGLVLTNAISYDSWPIPSVATMRATPGVVARTPAPMLKATLGTLLARGHDDPRVARESLEIHFARYERHGAGPALARQVSALEVEDTLAVADQLPQLRVPARVVWGLADQFQKAHYGERLARDLGTRPWGIRGGKHFTPEDHPSILARAISDVVTEAA